MKTQQPLRSASFPRRRFLGALGASSLVGGSGFLSIGQSFGQGAGGSRFFVREDRFGRMFPGLPAFAEPSQSLTEALLHLGKPGGLLDANDNVAAGPVALIVDPALNRNNPNNPGHTAGTTFMGQFLDHDVTFDLGSRLGVAEEPEDAVNKRTPSCDLDSVYGGGPRGSPELYGTGRDVLKLRVESGGQFEDLPRRSDGTAIIADPRNDENLMIAGLQAAFYLFHNHAVDEVRRRRPGLHNDEVFIEARRLTTWHYQWMIVHEFLPLFIGQSVVEDILFRGRQFYRPKVGFIPVEFQGAAYRFGHSMVRPSYRANLAGDNGAAFFGMIFDPAGEGQADPIDLRGGARAPRRFIDWQTFFNFGSIPRPSGSGTLGEDLRPNKLIDTRLSTPLFNLPLAAIASQDPPTSLPQRNLLRHVTWSLPSGQAIAREMRVDPLNPSELGELRGYGLALERSTPLWYYILKEASLRANGVTLGPVGGRIVGEVFVGLLQYDDESYLTQNPLWKPTLPTIMGSVTGEFRMIDFLAYAGVDPLSRAAKGRSAA
ncbi:MAG TPA: heme peroxidase family protein [Burkholderiales bacterium]|nr:heme peroxidase family protein [Burkholderiales bacterium]